MDQDELQLERDKLDFEKEQFRVDAAKRDEELRTLRAARLKTELEAEELKVPEKKRPAYRTARFQGIALVLAVGSALVSVGSFKPVLDAYKAEQDSKSAVSDQIRAQAERDAAIAAKRDATAKSEQAEASLNAAKSSLVPLQNQIEAADRELLDSKAELDRITASVAQAKKDVEIAPVEEILSSLSEKIDDVQSQRLQAVLSSGGPDVGRIRSIYAQGFVLDKSHPLMARLVALRALFNIASKQMPASAAEVADLRHQYVRLATSDNDVHSVHDSWAMLTTSLGAEAGPYLCDAYNNRAWPTAGHDPLRREMNRFIHTSFPASRECLSAYWDSIDPGQKDPGESNLALCERSPSALAWLRCLEPETENIDANGSGILVRERRSSLGLQVMDDAPEGLNLSAHANLSSEQLVAGIRMWFSQNQPLIEIFREPGLKRLRTCTLSLWQRLESNRFVGMGELTQLCPTETWKPAVRAGL